MKYDVKYTPGRPFKGRGVLLFFFLLLIIPLQAQTDYTEYKGSVVDVDSGQLLVSVSLEVKNTNIGTVTNSEGKFILKIPDEYKGGMVVVSLLGYQPMELSISTLKATRNKIQLQSTVTSLSEVNLIAFGNAEALVRRVFRDKEKNILDQPVLMTAFYRETIKKRSRNVSLTEAVVDLYKLPYSSSRKDVMALHKARKSTDYKRLDTVALKLQGGPFSTLYLDIMKYPEFIFTDQTIGEYRFEFESPSTINDRVQYVVKFTLRDGLNQPHYYGKLFIDAETLALTSATYQLNVGDRKLASQMFVKKKPRDVNAYPLGANYHVDYREKNGKWYYGYGNVELTFKVDKKGKLFNSTYTLSSEMAVTDWEKVTTDEIAKPKDRLRPSVVISDQISGFADPEFWGPQNIIEPEKSIEAAINKIRRQLKRGRG